jgi:hypothetical protein
MILHLGRICMILNESLRTMRISTYGISLSGKIIIIVLYSQWMSGFMTNIVKK